MQQAVDIFLKTCHFIHEKGWTPATAGNFSLRLAEKDFLVSASGVDKGKLSESDLIRISDGEPFASTRLPSAETLLHTALYRCFPDIRCIFHTHSVASTVLSIFKEQNTLKISGLELLKGLDGIKTHDATLVIPLIPNNQEMPVLVKEMDSFFSQGLLTHAFILRGHGLYTWGKTVEEARRHLECLEFLLEVHLELLKLAR